MPTDTDWFLLAKKSMRELLVDTEFKNEQVLRNKKTTCMKHLKQLMLEYKMEQPAGWPVQYNNS